MTPSLVSLYCKGGRPLKSTASLDQYIYNETEKKGLILQCLFQLRWFTTDYNMTTNWFIYNHN